MLFVHRRLNFCIHERNTVCLVFGFKSVILLFQLFPFLILKIFFAIGCSLLPYFYIRMTRNRRMRHIEEMLPDAIDLPIDQDTVIDGGNKITLDGDDKVRILHWDSGNWLANDHSLTLQHIVLQHGRATPTEMIPTSHAPPCLPRWYCSRPSWGLTSTATSTSGASTT